MLNKKNDNKYVYFKFYHFAILDQLNSTEIMFMSMKKLSLAQSTLHYLVMFKMFNKLFLQVWLSFGS